MVASTGGLRDNRRDPFERGKQVEPQDLEQRLSQISTAWTAVQKAHGAAADAQSAAQNQLMRRYSGAVYRYLLGAVRDPDTADELFQEFALCFIRGGFRHADPQRGRFRDYVKRALINLVTNYRCRQQRQPQAVPLGTEPVVASGMPDQEFLNSWRDELLARTWEALARVEQESGQAFHSILACRAKEPKLPSSQMAERLSVQLGRPLTAAGVRQTLRRARDRFADLLLDEIAHSLQTADLDAMEQELIDLGLLTYCQDALQRRRSPT